MKKVIIVLLSMILLTGCGVSNDTYESVMADYNELNGDYEEFKKSYDALNNNYINIKAELDELKKDNETLRLLNDGITEKYDKMYNQTGDDLLIETWGKTTFGEVECSSINHTTAQMIVTINEVSAESLKGVYDKLIDGIPMFKISTSVSDTKYVYVKIVDKANTPIMEYLVDVNEGSKMTVNIDYMDMVYEAFGGE